MTPQNNFYTKLGQECVGEGCSVDLFLFPNSYIDVATISEVSRLTGGSVYKYSYFQVSDHSDRGYSIMLEGRKGLSKSLNQEPFLDNFA